MDCPSMKRPHHSFQTIRAPLCGTRKAGGQINFKPLCLLKLGLLVAELAVVVNFLGEYNGIKRSMAMLLGGSGDAVTGHETRLEKSR